MLPQLTDTETFVKGRSPKTAQALLEAAGEDRTGEVRTVSHGYVVPSDILSGDEGYETYTASDRPAVPTQPGTTTNPDEANNVGQAATAVAQPTPETPGNDEVPNPETGEEPAEEFDPSKATVEEVITYLDGADDAERQRVLDAEAAGKGRKGIAEYTADSEGAK